MSWTDQSSVFGSNTLLTSTQMQNLRENYAAWAAGNSGSPPLQQSAIETYALTTIKCHSAVYLQLVDSGDSHNHDLSPLDYTGIDSHAITSSKMTFELIEASSHYLDAGSGNTWYPALGFYHFRPNNTSSNSVTFQILVNSVWRPFSNRVTGTPGGSQRNYGFFAWCDGGNMKWLSYDTAVYISYQKLW